MIETIQIKHQTGNHRQPVYSRSRCRHCHHETFLLVSPPRRDNGSGWYETLTCTTCGESFNRACLPVQCKRLDVLHLARDGGRGFR